MNKIIDSSFVAAEIRFQLKTVAVAILIPIVFAGLGVTFIFLSSLL